MNKKPLSESQKSKEENTASEEQGRREAIKKLGTYLPPVVVGLLVSDKSMAGSIPPPPPA